MTKTLEEKMAGSESQVVSTDASPQMLPLSIEVTNEGEAFNAIVEMAEVEDLVAIG